MKNSKIIKRKTKKQRPAVFSKDAFVCVYYYYFFLLKLKFARLFVALFQEYALCFFFQEYFYFSADFKAAIFS